MCAVSPAATSRRSFAYAVSFAFDSPRSAIVFVPLLVLLLIFFPVMVISVFNLAFGDNGADVFQLSPAAIVGANFWGVALCSPHGALFLGLADISVDFENLVENNPPFWALCVIMAAEGALYARAAYSVDSQVHPPPLCLPASWRRFFTLPFLLSFPLVPRRRRTQPSLSCKTTTQKQ